MVRGKQSIAGVLAVATMTSFEMHRVIIPAVLLLLIILTGCRGMESEREPIEVNLNMDFQERFDPQEANPFFADNRSMRPPVPGTVARGLLREDTPIYMGRTSGGGYLQDMPVPITRALLERGQDRYGIYCTVCHGAAGDAQGIIMVGTSTLTGGGYGFTPAPSFHDDRLRQVEDGYLYDTITNGIRNMPAYGPQIPVLDRWAIVAYVRALQRSQNATAEDVPADVRPGVRVSAAAPAAGAGADTSAGSTQDTTGETVQDTTAITP